MRSFRNVLLAVLFSLFMAHIVNAQIVVKVKPQRPKVVAVKVKQPAKGMIWIDGHWIVKNNKYVWVDGSWVKNRPHHIWIAGHWQKVRAGWRWIPGHWKKIHTGKQK